MGGTAAAAQLRSLREGVDIIVGTPGAQQGWKGWRVGCGLRLAQQKAVPLHQAVHADPAGTICPPPTMLGLPAVLPCAPCSPALLLSCSPVSRPGVGVY